jgi:hypothetical protein
MILNFFRKFLNLYKKSENPGPDPGGQLITDQSDLVSQH